MLESAVVNRYLGVLVDLQDHQEPEVRIYATQALLDMGVTGVSISDYLSPLVCLPVNDLTPVERFVRLTVRRKFFDEQ